MHRTGSAKQPDSTSGEQPGWPELFGSIPLAVFLVNPEDRIVRANASAEQLLNRSERQMVGRPVADLLRSPRDGTVSEGQDLAVFDAEIVTSRGTLRADFTDSHIVGRPGWRTIALYTAASRHLPGPTSGSKAAIGAAEMLAHEIKNPLSGIRGAAQLLGPGELTSLIVTEVDRIAALIDSMQDFTDTRPLELGPQNIYPVLAHVRSVALAGFAARTMIEERYDPSLPPARANRAALTQILMNLVKNAAEALDNTSEPRITIATAYRHGMAKRLGEKRQELPIEIAVIDNGPGPPAEIAGQLFDPFVSGRAKGSGLGLALVDKLVRDMGGLVQYAREQDRTIFRFFLPRADL